MHHQQIEVIAQGTPAVLDYLNNQVWWHLQRLIISGATGLGLLSVLILGVRWRMRRGYRKSKKYTQLTTPQIYQSRRDVYRRVHQQ